MIKKEKQKKVEKYIYTGTMVLLYVFLASRLPEYYYTNKTKFIIILMVLIFALSAVVISSVMKFMRRNK